MQIIGLTGGSGTGKSTVAQRLTARGAGHVDADAVYRTLCTCCAPMLRELQAAFGAVLTPSGALDRPALARIVFSDPVLLRRLNALVFPYVRRASLDAFAAQQARPFILYDAPTLYENGAQILCSAVVGVLAPYEMRLARIMARDSLSEAAARARLDAQPDDAFYLQRCDYILYNDGDTPHLFAQADRLYQTLVQH